MAQPALAIAVLAAAVLLPARTRAQRAQAEVIPAGHEAFFATLLGASEGGDRGATEGEPAAEITGPLLALPSACAFTGASIVVDHVNAHYRCDGEAVAVRLGRNATPPSDAELDPRGPSPVTLEVVAGTAPAALLDALDRRARANAARLPFRPPDHRPLERPRREPVTWLVLAFGVFAFAFAALAGADVRVAFRRHRAALALVALFVVAASFVPDAGPIHTHREFITRSDCAHEAACDESAIGWMAPAYHVHALAFEPLPYRLVTLTRTSLALSAVALFLLYLLVRSLSVRAGDDVARARATGLLAAGLTAFHPAFLRLSVSTTFWPWVAVALFASGIAGLEATATYVPVRRRAAWALAAAVFFALAVTTSLSMLVVTPLLALAPLAWPVQRTRRGVLVALAAVAIASTFIGAYAETALREALYAETTLVRPPADQLAAALENAIYFVPSLTPVPLAVALVLGVAATLRSVRTFRAFAPFVFAAVATESLLGPLEPWDYDFPIRFTHGQLSFFFAGALAARGVMAVRGLVATRLAGGSSRHARRVVPAFVLASLACVPFAHDSLFFLLHAQSHTLEARAVSDALPRLPPHAMLVVGPHFAPPIDGVGFAGDPIELAFPRGEHAATAVTAGRLPPAVLTIDEALAAPELDDDTLLYLGLSLVSWDPKEIEAGVVPRSLERPELARLRERYVMDPVVTFELDAVEHPSTLVRPWADLRRRGTLGFYRLHRRPRTPR